MKSWLNDGPEDPATYRGDVAHSGRFDYRYDDDLLELAAEPREKGRLVPFPGVDCPVAPLPVRSGGRPLTPGASPDDDLPPAA